MEPELMRIGVSLNNSLLERFDGIIYTMGYTSRSEGIREAIRNYIQYNEWMDLVDGKRIGILLIIYDQDKKGLADSLMQVQRENAALVRSAYHTSIDRENFMEIITLIGEGRDIKRMTDTFMSLKGVKHVKLTTVIPE